MAENIFSSFWYRVANVKLAMRSHVHIHQHSYRGNTWYILRDDSTGKHHRFSESAYTFIKYINNERTIDEIWLVLQDELDDAAPTQEEIIQLLGTLYFSGYITSHNVPDFNELIDRRKKDRHKLIKSRYTNPLAIRIPLIDPDTFLQQLLPVVKPLFSKTAAIAGIVIVLFALLNMVQHWQLLTKHIAENALAPSNLLILLMVYPFVKGLHELGHGLAVKYWGGEVHDMGVMMLVLIPVPYVDASAATSFRSKYKRMAVGGAGIAIELLLASIALLLWLNVQPGLVSDVLFNIMLIGGVSTLLFNGNPLLRFDGYYVLADAIEIPGLGNRANQYYSYLIQRYLFEVESARSPVSAQGEAFWFAIYGSTAFLYRMTIMVAIILFVATQYFFIGIALALWAIFMQVILPVYKAIRFLMTSPSLMQRRPKAIAMTLSTIFTLVLLVFTVPMPLNTMAQGVIWAPEQSYIRAGSDGFVEQILVAHGDFVENGDALIVTSDTSINSQLKYLSAQKHEQEILYDSLINEDIVKANITKEEITVLQGKITRIQQRIDDLTIVSPANGKFILPESTDLHGAFLKQGDPVGYVLDFSKVTVRTVVPQAAIGLVRKRTEAVEIKLPGKINERYESEIRREIPAATYRLPSKALSVSGGGVIQTDPYDKDGVKTKDQYFQFELEFPELTGNKLVGQRVYVRFSHGFEPLAMQWYRSFEEVFLTELGRI